MYIFSGSHPFVVFAKASILLNCKIQTLCIKTKISVSFTPPKVMNVDCIKMIYYEDGHFTLCQRVVEIRMNERHTDSRKQMEPDLSDVCIQKMNWQLFLDYYVVYGYNYSDCIYEVQIYSRLSVLQKFERFLEKNPNDSPVAFILNKGNTPFVPHFVKALLRHLGRKAPNMPMGNGFITGKRIIPWLTGTKYDPNIVQTWFSNNQARRDLIAHSSIFKNRKTESVINLSVYSLSDNALSAARNAISQYTHIYLPLPSKDEQKAMTFLSSQKNKASDRAYSKHSHNFEKYLRRTDI